MTTDRLAELRAFLEAISPFGSGDRALSESMVDKIMDRVAAIVAPQPAPDALRAAAQAVCEERMADPNWCTADGLGVIVPIVALRAALGDER